MSDAAADYARTAADLAASRICAPRFAATATAHAPNPIVWFRPNARILIASQAPGLRVHAANTPFWDASGKRLRDWMGVDEPTFYDRDRIAIVPMAFCFPGYDAAGSDLPPPKICAQTWHERVMATLPRIRLTLLVGGYSQARYLGRMPVTERVGRWRETWPDIVPLPHPSWRNVGWLKKNPWFEAELVPALRARIAGELA